MTRQKREIVQFARFPRLIKISRRLFVSQACYHDPILVERHIRKSIDLLEAAWKIAVVKMDFTPNHEESLKIVVKSFRSNKTGGHMRLEDGIIVLNVNNFRNTKNMIHTLLHEMVHLKQLLEGRLKRHTMRECYMFDGRVYLPEEVTSPSYFSQPWEEEAERITHELRDDVVLALIDQGFKTHLFDVMPHKRVYGF